MAKQSRFYNDTNRNMLKDAPNATAISDISDRLYNQGLAKASMRDLSGAISFLRLSIKYNKNNYNARNLLGLVYFEIGEVVSALEQWVISKNIKKEDNIADEYMDDIQANQSKLDTLNQAIKKYNVALTQTRQNSDDLAIIQLKKVISLNPNFIRAYCLLSLIYIKEQDIDKARKYLEKVIQVDKTNVLANKYLVEISTMTAVNNEDKTFLKEVTTMDDRARERESKKNKMGTLYSQIIYIFIGGLIGAALIAFLVIPGANALKNSKIKELRTQYNDLKAETDLTVEGLNAEINTLKDKLNIGDDPKSGDSDGTVDAEEQKQLNILYTAIIKYSNNELIRSADLVYGIDSNQIKSKESIDLYINFKQRIFSEIVTEYTVEGRKQYNNSQYEQGLASLQLAYKYLEGSGEILSISSEGIATYGKHEQTEALHYFLARAYQKTGNIEMAKEQFQIIINNYPQSEFYKNSVTYYNQITR